MSVSIQFNSIRQRCVFNFGARNIVTHVLLVKILVLVKPGMPEKIPLYLFVILERLLTESCRCIMYHKSLCPVYHYEILDMIQISCRTIQISFLTIQISCRMIQISFLTIQISCPLSHDADFMSDDTILPCFQCSNLIFDSYFV